MQLRKLTIENFRGITKLELELDETTVLIGENNTGKSSVLEALHLCMTRGLGRRALAFGDYDFHLTSANADPAGSAPIVITLCFEEAKVGEWPDEITQVLGDVIQILGDDRQSITFRVTAAFDKAIGDFATEWAFLDSAQNPLPAKPQRTVSDLQQLAPVFLLTAMREASQHFQPRSQFWGSFTRNPQIPDDKRKEIEEQVSQVNQSVLDSHKPFEVARDKLAKTGQLVPLSGTDLVTVEAVPMRILDMLARTQVKLAGHTGARLPIAQHGSGTQSLSVLFLFDAFLHSRLTEAFDKNASPILALEEPESHLHPSAVKALWPTLENLGGQKIIATHSGDLMSVAPLHAIRRLARKNGAIRVFRIGTATLNPVEHRKVAYHVKAKRGALLFARSWLLVEGESEFSLIPELALSLGRSFDELGICCVEYSQCGAAPLIKAADDLGIEWHLLADGDHSGQQKVATARPLLGITPEQERITTLNEPNIEVCLWNNGYDYVYESAVDANHKQMVSTQRGQPRYMEQTINAATKSVGKPPPGVPSGNRSGRSKPSRRSKSVDKRHRDGSISSGALQLTIHLDSMNESQVKATLWQDGALLVLAGPGSGKTRVLTYRVARLIEESPEARFRIVAVTFTNKAAAEMRSRVDGLVSNGRDRANITTFHSLAADLLRQHGSHIGLRPDFMILSEQADREAVLDDAIKSTGALNADQRPQANRLLPVIDRLLEECVTPDGAAQALRRSPNAAAIGTIYQAYRSALITGNQLDFGSLLACAVGLLEGNEAIARQVRRIYTYVCVDEFQDTNAAQYRFLLQLVDRTRRNLFVVADDDQLIYQWNGANPARLKALREHFDMSVLQLPVNFRCPPDVIALANNLIRHNNDRPVDKLPLISNKPPGHGRVNLEEFEEFRDEAAAVVEQIARVPLTERSSCVVLARRKKLLEVVLSYFEAAGIPAHIAIRKNEFQSAPFRWLHGMLRLANARNDREQLRRTSRAFAQLEGISVEVGDVVARAAADSGDFLREWMNLILERRGVEPATRSMLAATQDSLQDRLDYWSFVEAARKWFPLVEELPRDAEETAFDEYADEEMAWEALVKEIGTHYRHLSDLSLHQFLQELDLRAKEVPAPANAVRCLTIHASKGTEFRHVFLVGLVEDELPSWAAIQKGDDSDELHEERRNCFVAITRAEETLSLSYSGEYFGWPKEPSRFLTEMGFLE